MVNLGNKARRDSVSAYYNPRCKLENITIDPSNPDAREDAVMHSGDVFVRWQPYLTTYGDARLADPTVSGRLYIVKKEMKYIDEPVYGFLAEPFSYAWLYPRFSDLFILRDNILHGRRIRGDDFYIVGVAINVNPIKINRNPLNMWNLDILPRLSKSLDVPRKWIIEGVEKAMTFQERNSYQTRLKV
jgi:hypothetical protein